MAFPLIPLLVGAGAGAGVTYLAIKKTAREKISQSATQVTDIVKKGLKATQAKLSGEKDTETVLEPTTPIVEQKS
ncbi:hypothetical protein PN36_09945 [Candidatus Thiomargarita nelsonii]|uniref:Uncharacterized protein n=1 Tax=Candidatus Thiomargarita nelsonii TaxID=1003181 RepID=A0A4E0QUT8_9GAMM|nr:hypothetical protein PN36_09945 [Candidatus Thiomargarita nelsonii]